MSPLTDYDVDAVARGRGQTQLVCAENRRWPSRMILQTEHFGCMGKLLVDEYLPTFDVQTTHSIRIAAPAFMVYDEARSLDLSVSPLVRALFALRGMPSVTLTIDRLTGIGFKVLREDPGRGFVFGLVGQFWTPQGNLLDFEVERFTDFNTPTYAKGVWSFEVQDETGSTELTTITRVQCLDSSCRRRFQRYWFFVRPFSGLIRREALAIVKSRSESAYPASERALRL